MDRARRFARRTARSKWTCSDSNFRLRAVRFGVTDAREHGEGGRCLILWQAIRTGALGLRFRRQVILGPVIVDFFASSAGLVVEVDGGVHAAQRDADRIRDESLTLRGIRVVRIDASLVEASAERAVALVPCALR